MVKLSAKNTAVYEEVKRRILSGEFGNPGERFIGVQELATQFSVRTATALLFCDMLREESLILAEKQKYFLSYGVIPREAPVRKYRRERKIISLLTAHVFSYYLPAFADSAAQYLEKAGYSLMVQYLTRDNYREIVRTGYDIGVQGFLVLLDQQMNYNICTNSYLPTVTSGIDLTMHGTDSVLSGGQKQAAHLAELMLDKGCEEFFFACPDGNGAQSLLICKAFEEKLLEKGITFNKENILTQYELSHNRRFCAKRLTETGTRVGIVCTNENLCNLLLLCCDENGISIPDKLMIATYRTKTILNRVKQGIITVEENIAREAEEAVRLLLERVEGSTAPPQCVTVDPIVMNRGM